MKKYSISIACIGALLLLYGTAHATTWYVHPDSALNTIQAGIDSCSTGDTVLVGPGTYIENINFNGMAIRVMSEHGPDTTVIDGGQPSNPDSGSVILFVSSEDSMSIVEGFTIQNGTGTSNPYSVLRGGGILCRNASPTIRYNKFRYNDADVGGGIGCEGSSANARVTNNYFTNNLPDQGSAIICGGCSPVISRNLIYTNSGSAVELQYSNATIVHNTICHNDVGIRNCNHSFGMVINSIVYFNYINQIWSSSDSITVNYCDVQGGWPFIDKGYLHSDPNNIFWDREMECWFNYEPPENIMLASEIQTVRDTGNIDADPLFADTANHDYHLTWANFPIPDSTKSPCIDAGDPNYPLDPDSTVPDMGVYYFDQSTAIEEAKTTPIKSSRFGSTILNGPLILPEGKKCKVFDITGRVVAPDKIQPGVYFIEVDGVLTQKVVKVR